MQMAVLSFICITLFMHIVPYDLKLTKKDRNNFSHIQLTK